MDEFQARVRIPDIFDLYLIEDKSIANTPIETFDTLNPMIQELDDLRDAARKRPDDELVSEEDAKKLYVKYPFLEFTKQEPGLGDPFSELEIRLKVWSAARDELVEGISPEEHRLTKPFRDFFHQYQLNKFDFLPQQRLLTRQERLVLRHYGWDQLWIFTQNLKSKDLSGLHERDRKQLEQLVAIEIKDVLLGLEMLTIKNQLHEPDLTADEIFAKVVDTATFNVEERISSGDWQAPAGPNRFTFNGLHA